MDKYIDRYDGEVVNGWVGGGALLVIAAVLGMPS